MRPASAERACCATITIINRAAKSKVIGWKVLVSGAFGELAGGCANLVTTAVDNLPLVEWLGPAHLSMLVAQRSSGDSAPNGFSRRLLASMHFIGAALTLAFRRLCPCALLRCGGILAARCTAQAADSGE